jgi:hypothetical protein
MGDTGIKQSVVFLNPFKMTVRLGFGGHRGYDSRSQTESRFWHRSRRGIASRWWRYGASAPAGWARAGARIVLGANDFDGDTAERYGYINRALPDSELDGFIHGLARRIASFDRRAIAAAKNLINQVSSPSADRLLASITSFEAALTWPETQQRIHNLLQLGLQRDSDFETRWPEVLLGTLLET